MESDEKDRNTNNFEDSFVSYDPDNLPYMILHTCEIIRDLPELTPEEIEKFREE